MAKTSKLPVGIRRKILTYQEAVSANAFAGAAAPEDREGLQNREDLARVYLELAIQEAINRAKP